MASRYLLISCMVFLAGISAFSRNDIDSVEKILETTIHDSVRINILLDLSDEYGDVGLHEDGIKIGHDALALSEKLIEERKFLAFAKEARMKAHQLIGLILESTDHYTDAVNYYMTALKYAINENSLEYQCKLVGNLGMYYYNVGDYPSALKYSLQQLSLAQKLNDKMRIASAYNKIGITYKRQMMHEEALEHLFKSVALYEELNEQSFVANGWNNIGNVYFNMQKYDLAYEYYMKQKAIGLELENSFQVADAHNCTAEIFNEVASFPTDSILKLFYKDNKNSVVTKSLMLDSAEYYFKQAIQVYDSLFEYYELADCYNGLGRTYLLNGKFNEAIETFNQGYELAKTNGILEKEITASYGLFETYRLTNNFEASLNWYELYNTLTDSVFSDSKSREFGRLQSKHEFDIKESMMLAAQEQERILADSEKHKQQTILIIVSIGLGLVFVLLIFLFNRFRLIQKQKRTIEHHKAEVEEKQKEILDSITYAKRLQHAILAKEENIEKYFPQSFLLYKPKDIVAGDFYFFETTATHVFYAAADCTGHGVPGAMVSIVCSNALTRSIKEFGITDPGKILDKTRELVVETFEKSGTDVKDGMDISLISKNLQTNEIKWSGAHNPLWIIDNNSLQEIKPDKQPIGKSENATPFKTHIIQASVNAVLYLFTDGYSDQFGGDKGKKFNASQHKELLLDACTQPMNVQKNSLEKTFENWRGNLEQVDDVCVLGVRI